MANEYKLSYTAAEIDEKLGKIGEPVSWDDLTNKPFYDTTIVKEYVYNADMSNKEYIAEDPQAATIRYWVKVSDDVEFNLDIDNCVVHFGTSTNPMVQELNLTSSGIQEIGNGDAFYVAAAFIIVKNTINMGFGDIAPGVWFLHLSSGICTTKLQYKLSGGELVQIDEKYIPSIIARTEQVEAKADATEFISAYTSNSVWKLGKSHTYETVKALIDAGTPPIIYISYTSGLIRYYKYTARMTDNSLCFMCNYGMYMYNLTIKEDNTISSTYTSGVSQTRTINGYDLKSNITLTASDVDALSIDMANEISIETSDEVTVLASSGTTSVVLVPPIGYLYNRRRFIHENAVVDIYFNNTLIASLCGEDGKFSPGTGVSFVYEGTTLTYSTALDRGTSLYNIKIDGLPVFTEDTVIKATYRYPKYMFKEDRIPDTIARISDVEEMIEENKHVPSDWNAKDGEDGYIQNRTHYEDITETTSDILVWDATDIDGRVTAQAADGTIYIKISDSAPTLTDIDKGGYSKMYAYNGTSNYTTELIRAVNSSCWEVSSGVYVIGQIFVSVTQLAAGKYNSSFEITFPEAGLYANPYGDGTRTLSINDYTFKSISKNIKQLDEKYIPNAIARLSDVEAMITGAIGGSY